MSLIRSKFWALGVLFVIAPGFVRAQPAPPGISQLLGTFTISTQFSSTSITIRANHRYLKVIHDCTSETEEAGSYKVENGVITLTQESLKVRDHGSKHWKDLLDPRVYRERYGEAPPSGDPPEEFVPISWGERLYLVHQDSLVDFVNAINLAIEPRAGSCAAYFGVHLLRDGDEKKVPVGHPALPADLLSLLLDKTVDAQIISVSHQGDELTATIDRGSKAGLRPHMRLIGINKAPVYWQGMEVLSVQDQSAQLKLYEEARVGDKVTSKYLPVRLEVTLPSSVAPK
ncbi:MAG TPA: hypothetical protein VE961_25295 [Pyrinomonadaceae bacterium]|nr:hypothetical protein [Pyrinomonadaceae bacterium]